MISDDSSASGSPPASARAEARPLDWPRLSGQVEPVVLAIERHARRIHRRRMAAAGAGLAVLIAAGFIWKQNRPAVPAAPASSQSIVSLPATRALPDGSIVELKGDASIIVDFSGALRRVALRRGEALFKVAKDRTRPFVVEAAGVQVRAVGTAFSVQLSARDVQVLVTEGRVWVGAPAVPTAPQSAATGSIASSDPRTLAVVDAGNRVVVDTTTRSIVPAQVQAVPESEIAEQLAWRVPRLEFNATPLSEVIAAFNQHGHTRLSLADPELGGLPLSGVLRADNVGVLLRILETSYGIQGDHKGDEIVLRKAP